jgi:uncharacterized beta barrel domain-containing protein DUF5777
MTRTIVFTVLFLSSVPGYAMPQFLELYRSDPFRNPSVDGCITCHMSPQGGDARNAFGQAFESGGEQITPMLRAQFPDRFVYPISRVSDALTVHFSDPNKKQVVIETSGMKNLVDVEKTAVNGVPSNVTTSPTRLTIAETQAEQRSDVRVDRDAREGAFFGSNIVNLPDGKPQKAGGVDFSIGHRFGQGLCGSFTRGDRVGCAAIGDLFGFDSSATVALGVRVGITDRLSVSFLRSNLFKTISLGSALQVSRQSSEVPITLQLRAGVDGKNNFGWYDKEKNPTPRQYSPYIQLVGTRTFKDRVSFTLVPMVAFNTREEDFDIPDFAFGTNHNDTLALGIGAGIRFLRSTSIVGEFIPRLSGFKGREKNRPGVSIGLQKSTFRHTFELLISRQDPMTPAQYAFQGTDTFRIGFNIYRKIR